MSKVASRETRRFAPGLASEALMGTAGVDRGDDHEYPHADGDLPAIFASSARS